jgi:hypothetical protein
MHPLRPKNISLEERLGRASTVCRALRAAPVQGTRCKRLAGIPSVRSSCERQQAQLVHIDPREPRLGSVKGIGLAVPRHMRPTS